LVVYLALILDDLLIFVVALSISSNQLSFQTPHLLDHVPENDGFSSHLVQDIVYYGYNIYVFNHVVHITLLAMFMYLDIGGS